MSSNLNINLPNLVVDNYETKEVIHFVSRYLNAVTDFAGRSISEENMYQLIANLADLKHVAEILSALDKKVNGQNKPTVVQ